MHSASVNVSLLEWGNITNWKRPMCSTLFVQTKIATTAEQKCFVCTDVKFQYISYMFASHFYRHISSVLWKLYSLPNKVHSLYDIFHQGYCTSTTAFHSSYGECFHNFCFDSKQTWANSFLNGMNLGMNALNNIQCIAMQNNSCLRVDHV